MIGLLKKMVGTLARRENSRKQTASSEKVRPQVEALEERNLLSITNAIMGGAWTVGGGGPSYGPGQFAANPWGGNGFGYGPANSYGQFGMVGAAMNGQFDPMSLTYGLGQLSQNLQPAMTISQPQLHQMLNSPYSPYAQQMNQARQNALMNSVYDNLRWMNQQVSPASSYTPGGSFNPYRPNVFQNQDRMWGGRDFGSPFHVNPNGYGYF